MNILLDTHAAIWFFEDDIRPFDDGFDGFVDAIHKNEFSLLKVDPEHIRATMNLPHIHRDPLTVY